MTYLNLELENLSDCIDRTGIKKLEVNETGILLHGLMIIEAQLKKLGLVSHLLKNIKNSIYNKSIWDISRTWLSTVLKRYTKCWRNLMNLHEASEI